jgi:hypothetical protein
VTLPATDRRPSSGISSVAVSAVPLLGPDTRVALKVSEARCPRSTE